MSTELPTYITLEEAARRYRISREVLTNLVESGKIKAVKIDGRVAVADMDIAVVAAQLQIKEDDELVSLNEAARRLGLSTATIWWWHRRGWLPGKGYGPNRTILVSFNRARALATLRENFGKGRGHRLIDKRTEQELLAALP
jgi:excisionase family DNA binding protein